MCETRSGYSDDCENLELYRRAVENALSGKRGQSFLREMAASLDAMPEKMLIRGELVDSEGRCCAIGSVYLARGMDIDSIVYDLAHSVGKAMGIATSMAREIEYENDEYDLPESPEERWKRMRRWVQRNISSTGDDDV